MIVLALDTALSATSVAVADGGKLLAVRSEPMDRGHQERLAGLVRDTMAETRVEFAALQRIGVTIGPGSFTGLRVGLAFAKGLSLALDIPCVGVGTLQALASSVDNSDLIAAAIDARRDQLYLQLFRGGAPVTEPEALPLTEADDRLNAWVEDGPITVVGSGATLLAAKPNMSIVPLRFANPVALAGLTAAPADPVSRPEPLYLRAPDARTIAERAAVR